MSSSNLSTYFQDKYNLCTGASTEPCTGSSRRGRVRNLENVVFCFQLCWSSLFPMHDAIPNGSTLNFPQKSQNTYTCHVPSSFAAGEQQGPEICVFVSAFEQQTRALNQVSADPRLCGLLAVGERKFDVLVFRNHFEIMPCVLLGPTRVTG